MEDVEDYTKASPWQPRDIEGKVIKRSETEEQRKIRLNKELKQYFADNDHLINYPKYMNYKSKYKTSRNKAGSITSEPKMTAAAGSDSSGDAGGSTPPPPQPQKEEKLLFTPDHSKSENDPDKDKWLEEMKEMEEDEEFEKKRLETNMNAEEYLRKVRGMMKPDRRKKIKEMNDELRNKK